MRLEIGVIKLQQVVLPRKKVYMRSWLARHNFIPFVSLLFLYSNISFGGSWVISNNTDYILKIKLDNDTDFTQIAPHGLLERRSEAGFSRLNYQVEGVIVSETVSYLSLGTISQMFSGVSILGDASSIREVTKKRTSNFITEGAAVSFGFVGKSNFEVAADFGIDFYGAYTLKEYLDHLEEQSPRDEAQIATIGEQLNLIKERSHHAIDPLQKSFGEYLDANEPAWFQEIPVEQLHSSFNQVVSRNHSDLQFGPSQNESFELQLVNARTGEFSLAHDGPTSIPIYRSVTKSKSKSSTGYFIKQ